MANLNPMDPSKWGEGILKDYIRLHNTLGDGDRAFKRTSLVESVARDLCRYYITCEVTAAKDLQPPPVDICTVAPETLLNCGTSSEAAALLRECPAQLDAIVEAGIRALSPSVMQRLHSEGLQPPVERWLFAVAGGIEKDRVLREAVAKGDGGRARLCGRNIESHEALVYCFECAAGRQCVMCAECFKNSPCVNHRHVVKCGSGNGICDCGDPDAWRVESFCTRHRGFTDSDDPLVGMDAKTRAWIAALLRGLVRYQVAVMQHWHSVVKGQNDDKTEIGNRTLKYGVEVSMVRGWVDRFLRRAADLTLMLAQISEGSRRLLCEGLLCDSILLPVSNCPLKRLRSDGEGSDSDDDDDDAYDNYDSNDEEDEEGYGEDEVDNAKETKDLKDAGTMRSDSGAVSCLEAIFLLDMALGKMSDLGLWRSSIVFILDKCVVDPFFRVPCGALLLKYREYLVTHRSLHVEKLFVQVFSVQNVVDTLLYPPPVSVHGHSNNAVQRMLSTLFYLCNSLKCRRPLRVESYLHFGWCMHTLLTASERARGLLVSSRSLLTDWCTALCMIARASVLRRKADSESRGKFYIEQDRAMWMDSALSETSMVISDTVFDVGMALCSNAPLVLGLRELSADLFTPAAEAATASENYLRSVLTVAAETITASLAAYRRCFAAGASSCPLLLGGAISAYDLLAPHLLHPTCFIRTDLHFFARVAAVWPRLCDSAAEIASGEWPGPLSSALAHVGWRAEHWIDAAAMPFVLVGLVEQGLWRSGHRDVLRRVLQYMQSGRSDMDAGLLQLVLGLVAPVDFAAQLLQRHSYVPRERGRGMGYPYFLRHVLMLSIAECGVVAANTEDVKYAMRRRIVHALAEEPHLSISSVNEVVEAELEYAETTTNVHAALREVLDDVAVSRELAHGKRVFQLRSAAVWRAHVDLYFPLVRDHHLSDMHEQWTRLLRQEKARPGHEQGGETHQKTTTLAFPPPVLRWLGRKRELQQMQRPTAAARIAHMHERACVLLQTPAVLSVAVYVVHEYVRRVVPRNEWPAYDALGSLDEVDTAKSEVTATEDEKEIFTNYRTLAHAVAVLYLAAQGAAELTGASSVEKIDWTAVSSRLRGTVPAPSITPDAIEALLPVKGFTCAEATLREHMRLHVPYTRRGASSFPSTGMTTAEALHLLAGHVRAGGADMYGVAVMAESVLVAVGARSPEADDGSGAVDAVAEDDQRRRRLKEKQAALLRRVRGTAAKSVAALTKGNETVLEETVPCPLREASGEAKVSVAARLLLRSAGEECCICRNNKGGTLYFFGNMSTSDVLNRLRFAEADSDSETRLNKEVSLNVHFAICGHMAHKNCVTRAFGYITKPCSSADIFADSFSPPQKDFRCPLCVMICTMLSHVPQLVRELEPSSTLFETVRRDTVSLEGSEELPVAVAAATVGRTVSTTSGDKQNLLSEPELHKRAPDVWNVVVALRAVRSQMRVALEWVKAGGTVRYKDLMGILMLLIAIRPADMERPGVEEAIRSGEGSEGTHKEEEAELCTLSLIFDVVKNPKEVALYIETQAIRIALYAVEWDVLTQKNEDEDEEGSALTNRLVMVLWRELGCLTLLRLLLDDRAVVPVESAIADESNSDYENDTTSILRESNNEIIIQPLEPAALETTASRRHAVLLMFCYLLARPVSTTANSELSSLLSLFKVSHPRSLLAPLPVPYGGPAQWRQFLVHRIFHHHKQFGQMLLNMSLTKACSVCGNHDSPLLTCCYCERTLCSGGPSGNYEIFDHVRQCGAGVGVFWRFGGKGLLVVLTVTGRYVVHPGLYANEYGEMNFHQRYCESQPGLNDYLVMSWLSLWIRSRWCVESSVVRRLSTENPIRTPLLHLQ